MKKRIVKAMLSLTLAATLTITSVVPTMAAATSPDASAAREAENAQISQDAATQGMVLLDNKNSVLPIAKSGNVALYGAGVYATVTGGTGSGSVNLKDGAQIDVQQGFEDAGYNIVNEEFLADQIAAYNAGKSGFSGGMWGSYKHDEAKYDESEIEAAAAKADTAIYVLTRNSGEGSDRTATTGDYYLSDNEAANLALLGKTFENVIVVLNVGGVVDTNFYTGAYGEGEDTDGLNRTKIEGLDALFLMSQAGMNGGAALVEVLNGTVNPSGKLTDTWANEYSDYPSSATFSANDKNTAEEIYTDDIYVGYRYFDTYGLEVAYPFGYGGSYTTFDIAVTSVKAGSRTVTVTADVTNTGDVDGREVVEVYYSAPTGSLDKPFQELAAYEKVSVAAGATETVTITYDTTDMASYNETEQAYVMEKGNYTIRVGNSSRNTVVAATLTLDKDVVTEQCENQLGLTRQQMIEGTYTDGVVLNRSNPTSTASTPAYGVSKIEGVLTGSKTGITPTTEGLSATPATTRLSASNFAATVDNTKNYTKGAITTYVSSDTSKNSAEYAIAKKVTDNYVFNGKTTNNGTLLAEDGAETLETVEAADGATLVDVVEGKITMEQLVADMSNLELIDLVEGGTYSGVSVSDSSVTEIIGSQSVSTKGAAGETTSNLYTTRYIPNIVMSDGPAGLRITTEYKNYTAVTADDGYDPSVTYYTTNSISTAQKVDITSEEEYQAYFAVEDENGKTRALYASDDNTYYQYCTAFPIGTMLAQTWDTDLIKKVGRAIQTEMLEYGVTSYLAPGMNIHRNPLCGRNFEYYSEDPVVAGLTAAAETEGVETKEDGSDSGVGVTLKHFAFNNQEANRSGGNSVVSERAAREIYLKGFEIAVKNSKPDYIMTSYNMVNGTGTYLNYGLVTEMLRNEWGFDGFVMTDWGAVNRNYGKLSGLNAHGLLMRAGNDCVMPGRGETTLLTALREGKTVRLGDLQRSAINMLNVIARSAVFDTLKAKLDAADDSTDENPGNTGDVENPGNTGDVDNAGTDDESSKTISDLQDKLDAANKTNTDNAATIKDLTDKLAEAQKKVDDLTASIGSSTPSGSTTTTTTTVTVTDPTTAADLKAAQEELASVKEQLEAAQKAAEAAATVTIATDKSSYSVKKGSSFKITAVSSNGEKVTYTSKNTKIAKVSSKGKVTGVKKGSTKIVVKVGTVKKTVKVTVK